MIELIQKIIDYIKHGKKKDGLVDITDDRSFGSRAVYKPNKADLEEAKKKSFIVFDPKKQDQLDSDFCVGFGSSYEADATESFDGESKQGSGAYVFAMAKKWSGASLNSFGTSLLAGCMARVKYGICSKEKWDYKRGRRNYFANHHNIPKEAHLEAKDHKAESAWQLDIPWGWTKFDAILATLYHFKDKKVLIGTGDKAHRRTIIGYDKERDCLINCDTYGTRTYEKGWQYITRTRARTLFTPHFVLDIPRNLAEILVKFNDKVVKTKNSNNCYFIEGGKKRHIPDEDIANAHGFLLAPHDHGKLTEIIRQQDLDMIPKGDNLQFKDGKLKWIMKRYSERKGFEIKHPIE